VQLAERVGGAAGRVGAHPRSAHLVGAEDRLTAGAERHRGQPLDPGVEVVAAPPGRHVRVQPEDLSRAGRLVDARQLSQAAAEVPPVELVVQRVPVQPLAGRAQGDPAVATVAQQQDQRGGAGAAAHQRLVLDPGPPRRGGGRQAAGEVRPLEQEPEAVLEVGELVDDRRLRRPPPGALLLLVDAADRPGGVQPQVVAGGRPADPGAQQQRRRLQRAAGHHYQRRAHGQLGGGAALVAAPRQHPGGGAVRAHQHPLGPAADHHARAAVAGVLQEGPQRALLGGAGVAEAGVAGARGVVAVRVQVQHPRRMA
jgi:hypothetical protein